jgi:hypothetical protein
VDGAFEITTVFLSDVFMTIGWSVKLFRWEDEMEGAIAERDSSSDMEYDGNNVYS